MSRESRAVARGKPGLTNVNLIARTTLPLFRARS